MGHCYSKQKTSCSSEKEAVLEMPEKTEAVCNNDARAPSKETILLQKPPLASTEEPHKELDMKPTEDSGSWIPAPHPHDDDTRISILKCLNILDSDREERRFRDITKLICSAFDVPIAAVSLVDSERQWFKSAEGLGDTCQTGRDESFCSHTLLPHVAQILVVEDTYKDVRFSGNPLVLGPPHIRFYAGAPLVSSISGYRYGSLCVIDTKPHVEFTSSKYNLLAQFAELAVREIEKDKLKILQKMVEKQRTSSSISCSASPLNSMRSSGTTNELIDNTDPTAGLNRAADCFIEGVLLVDISGKEWPIVYANSSFNSVIGVPADEAMSQGFWDLFDGSKCIECMAGLKEAVSNGDPFTIEVMLRSIYAQKPITISFDFRPAAVVQLGGPGIPSTVPEEESDDAGSSSKPLLYFAIADPGPGSRPSSMRSSSLLNSIGKQERTNTSGTITGAPKPVTMDEARAMFNAATLPSGVNPSMPNLSKSMPSAFEDVRLGPLIGRGAYGRVYRGSWNGNIVAVKVMETTEPVTDRRSEDLKDVASTDELSRIQDPQGLFEAVLSSSLSHPNIVHTYQFAVRPLPETQARAAGLDTGAQRDQNTAPSFLKQKEKRLVNEVWIISEFCNKGPLLTAIERGAFLTNPSLQYGQPNLIAVLQTLQEIAAAMQYLHSHHIIHGDLTGGNVLLTSSDKDARGFTAKVVDFGLSRFCAGDDGLKTKTMGCAEYMPRELITGGILTKASDVYAFGILIWEMYVGRRAWEGLAPGAVLKKVAAGETVTFPTQTPHRLRVLGERCLAMNAEDRPTFNEVVSEVNAILNDTMSILQQFLHSTAVSSVS